MKKSDYLEIIHLNEIVIDEIATIKGMVVLMTQNKNVVIKDKVCGKNECTIVDRSSCIQVVLCGELCKEDVLENKT